MDAAHLLSLVGALRSRTVAVIGDVMADEYVYGRVARISREAPVLILEYDSTEIVPGGGANAANNVAALGGRAALVGLVGRDEPGRRLLDVLEARVDRRGIVRANGRATPVKTRDSTKACARRPRPRSHSASRFPSARTRCRCARSGMATATTRAA